MRSDARISELLGDLNEPQQQAVTHVDGPLLVLAGPGSGKTRVITRRAAYLVHAGVWPTSILAITFTNKAAEEMRRRIETLGVARGMWVYTFHALGVRLLREFGPLARIRPGFSIYDDADQIRAIRQAMEICKLSVEVMRPESFQAAISRAKNELTTPAQYMERADFFDARNIARVYEAYEQILEQNNAVDFDDLLMRVAVVLRDHPDVTERLNERFRYVLVDEYQDTNHAQYLIARSLSRHHRNLCVTGDPDQSIYGWRGADLNNILEFEQDYPDARVVRLEENYRSHGNILRVASKLIAENRRRKHKDLWTHNSAGEPVRIWEFSEGLSEAERIADTIRALAQEGRRFSDFAVFYRVNALSRGLEDAFRLRGIPYRIVRGVEFFNRAEIRDVLAYLRVVVNPSDRVALLRIINTPTRGIGKTTIERLTRIADGENRPLIEVLRNAGQFPEIGNAAAKIRRFVELLDQLSTFSGGSVQDAVSNVLVLTGLEDMYRKERESGGEDRLANVQELVTVAARFELESETASLTDFLTRIALTSDQDQVDRESGQVMLMTLHAAKGLEFPVVFLSGLEQGLLPHERAIRGDGDVEEERRLCFVGITRAQDRLYITCAQERMLRGQRTPQVLSQFLREMRCDATTWEAFEPREGRLRTGGELDEGRRVVPTDEMEVDASESEARGSLESETRRGYGAGSFRARLRGARGFEEERTFSPNDPAGKLPPPPVVSPYAEWTPGMFVTHKEYGVGQLLWIHPNPGQTRAGIQFPGHGQKTFVLEKAPVQKLARPPKKP